MNFWGRLVWVPMNPSPRFVATPLVTGCGLTARYVQQTFVYIPLLYRHLRALIRFVFIPLLSDGDCCPIYGSVPAPPQGYGKCARAHLAPGYASRSPSPQIGQHWESIPGPPDPQTEALPTELARPPVGSRFFTSMLVRVFTQTGVFFCSR